MVWLVKSSGWDMRAITSVQQQIEVFGQNFGNIFFLVFLKQGKGTSEKVA